MRTLQRILLLIVVVMSSVLITRIQAQRVIEDDGECECNYRFIAPNLAARDIVGCKIGLWPYRKTGVRLEVEQIEQKLIVHDYGHGVSGLWLSWGCADVAVDLMRNELRRLKRQSTKKIAVIGAGVIGLTTAYILLSKGYRVTIYTRDMTPDTNSDIPAGLAADNFQILAGNTCADQGIFNQVKAISLAKFKELVTTVEPEIKGAFYSDVYCFDTTAESTKRDGLDLQVGGVKTVTVGFDTGIHRKAQVYKDIVIDRTVYLQDLLTKIYNLGGIVKRQTIRSINDLIALPEKVVCNCMGLGSAAVFDDPELVPLKGYAITVKPHDGVNYVVHARLTGSQAGEYISYQQWGDRGIVLGGLIHDDWNDFVLQEPVDLLMDKVRKFFAFPRGTLHFPA